MSMRKSRISNKVRKLEDTSWLAQIIKDKMDVEFDKNGASARWHCLHTLHIIVNEADDPNVPTIYYDNHNGRRSIVICEIPSLVLKHGSDFDRYGMQNSLRGLAERYKDDDGNYIVSVLTTHDLNSAIIKDVSELLFQMGH
jgi:hypothetical protein